MSKISLNPKYTNVSGTLWTTTTYNNLQYYKSQNKSHSSVSTLKCTFTTPYDNIDIQVEIGASSESNYDICYIGQLDNSSPTYDSNLDKISGDNKFKTITINVAKAGDHFLIIGYRKDGSGSNYGDCGYFRLITTEVDSLKPQPYIYCGTKTTVSEEPIVFSKKNDSSVAKHWTDYQGSNKDDYLWESNGGDSEIKTAKISFATLDDNTIVTLKYNVKFDYSYQVFRVTDLDATSNFISEYGKCDKKVTKEITVPKAGEHFIIISYMDEYMTMGNNYVYVGFFGTNVVTNIRTLVPKNILANDEDISEVYVGSELIWEKSRIMWFQNESQEMTFAKDSSGNVLNGKVTIPTNTYDKFSYGNNVISGSNDYNSQTYYGLNVKDIIKNGYIYLVNYQRAMDLSAFPNPVNMEYRHGWSNRVGTCMFLKINSRLKKETTSLSNMFNDFNRENYNWEPTEPLIMNHEACNIVGLDKLNTSNVTNMSNMFYRSRIGGNLDFSKWDTGKVTDMSYMFSESNGQLNNYTYITGLNNWNLQSVQNISYMFSDCNNYDFQDKELTWNTSNVTDMSYMFKSSNIHSFPKLSFDTRNVTNMAYMFNNFKSYNDLKLNFNNTSKVTDMQYMFGISNSDIYHFNPDNYRSYFNYHGDADISCLDTSNVINTNCMFDGCIYITPDIIKNIRLPKVTSMRQMFLGAYMGGWDFVNNKATYIDTIDLSSFDLGSISDSSSMYKAFNFSGVQRIYTGDYNPLYTTYINNLILDNWRCFKDVSKEIKFSSDSPFYGCNVTYCYIRGCNDNTKRVIKQMFNPDYYRFTYAHCSYFIED